MPVLSSTRLFAILTLTLLLTLGCKSDDPVSPNPVGTFVINPSPDILNASWTLTGPDSYSKSSAGDETLNKLAPGDYTITWNDISGWLTPAAETRTLADGAIETLSGAYIGQNGIIIIATTPDDIDAPWTLAGPANFNTAGQGQLALSNMAVGDYTLTWGDVIDWATPAAETLTVDPDVLTTFTGTYVKKTGYILINPTPSYLEPRWLLYGPNLFKSGYGDTTLVGMEYGEYRISWSPLAGWVPPPSQDQTLNDDGPLVFEGAYVEEVTDFAGSEDQLMLNFRLAYEEMNYNSLRNMLHPDFVMILSSQTQEEFPDLGQTLDLTEELRIADRMFRGEPVTDPGGNLIPGISNISFMTMENQGKWETSLANDPIPSTRFALYDVNIWLARPGFSTLIVDGVIKFYAVGRDSLHEGINRTYFEMIGQNDFTGDGLKSVENANWGSVKALFR